MLYALCTARSAYKQSLMLRNKQSLKIYLKARFQRAWPLGQEIYGPAGYYQ